MARSGVGLNLATGFTLLPGKGKRTTWQAADSTDEAEIIEVQSVDIAPPTRSNTTLPGMNRVEQVTGPEEFVNLTVTLVNNPIPWLPVYESIQAAFEKNKKGTLRIRGWGTIEHTSTDEEKIAISSTGEVTFSNTPTSAEAHAAFRRGGAVHVGMYIQTAAGLAVIKTLRYANEAAYTGAPDGNITVACKAPEKSADMTAAVKYSVVLPEQEWVIPGSWASGLPYNFGNDPSQSANVQLTYTPSGYLRKPNVSAVTLS